MHTRKLTAALFTVAVALATLTAPAPAPALETAPATPAQAGEQLVRVLPSGCIQISPVMQQLDQYPWWHYNTIYSYVDPTYGIMRRIAYKLRQPAAPNEFIGAVFWPGGSYYYNAPVGLNQLNRAINCMLSGGASQG